MDGMLLLTLCELRSVLGTESTVHYMLTRRGRLQLTRDKILYAWVDSADWMEGIEFRLGVMPPRQPFHRCRPKWGTGLSCKAPGHLGCNSTQVWSLSIVQGMQEAILVV